MKNFIFTFLFISLATLLYGQRFEWARSLGSTLDDASYSIDVDANGNVFTTGVIQGDVDFDPGSGTYILSSNGGRDAYVQKLDAAGNLLWAKVFGGVADDVANRLVLDAIGNVYITGFFIGTVDFDPGPGNFYLTSTGYSDCYILKLDAAGNFVWAKALGATSGASGSSIALDTSGDLYIAGGFYETVDLDPGPGTNFLTSNGGQDVFLQKMDTAGNFVWAVSFGGPSDDKINQNITDKSGNSFLTGSFSETVDFDPGLGTYFQTSNGGQDIYILTLKPDGSFASAKTFGGTMDDTGAPITMDDLGNVYAAGFFQGTVDFDPGINTYNLTSKGDDDIFIYKMDVNGNFLWAKSFGGPSIDHAFSIITDKSGDIYTGGYFSETTDFDPDQGTFDLTSKGNEDCYIQKLDADGNFVWAKSFGGPSKDYITKMKIDASNNICTTGLFKETVDFDPGFGSFNLTSNGDYDIFTQTLSQCVNSTGTDVVSACNNYTWIDGKTYTASNDTATYLLVNHAGCDSIVTLHLTINTVDISVGKAGTILTSNAANASYQWLDCDDNNKPITGETNQSYTAKKNGNYAVVVTQNGCTDTSSCYAITTVSNANNIYTKNILIYPNPVTDLITIDPGERIKACTVIISDIFGKEIKRYYYENTSIISLHLDSPSGIYFITLITRDKKSTLRLVKN